MSAEARAAAAEATRDIAELTQANHALGERVGALMREGKRAVDDRDHARNALRACVMALVALGAGDARSRRALRLAAGSDDVSRRMIASARRTKP